MYEELAAFAKVHLLQSLISGILVETVFSAYFVGLSEEQTEQFRQVEKLLRSFSESPKHSFPDAFLLHHIAGPSS